MSSILERIGYSSELEYHNRIIYLMILCSVLVAGFYLLVYLFFIPLIPAILVQSTYIVFSISFYIFLKKKNYIFVKFAMIIAHMIQLTLAVYVWFPVQTGYNLYYFMVPMVAFLIMEYDNRSQMLFAVSASISATLLYFLSELFVWNFYIFETTDIMNRVLSGTSILFIFLPMIYIFTTFSYDLYKSHKALKSHANTDYLTKTYNRRVLFESGESAISLARSRDVGFSLIVFDIDFFKKVNDQHGHPVGDELLKQLAALVLMNIRQEDVFARYGGEEFAILLQGANSDQAYLIAQSLLETIHNKTFVIDECFINITVSIGLTQYISSYNEFKEMMKEADDALYIAKNNGRNQVIVHKSKRVV